MQREWDWSIAIVSFITTLKAMKVRILAIVIASTLVNSPSALAEGLGEFYTRLNVNAQSSEEGEGRFSEIRSNNSWLGIRGNVAIDNDLSVVYRLEWKVDITQE